MMGLDEAMLLRRRTRGGFTERGLTMMEACPLCRRNIVTQARVYAGQRAAPSVQRKVRDQAMLEHLVQRH
jgi:hypothetical protein